MQMPMFWGEPEKLYLRKYFDGVDRAISEEMQVGKSVSEESLTFMLARLLDDQSTFQRMLDYSIEELNNDLDNCGTGAQISIEFETNEHKKHFESSVSNADLGIVLTRERSILDPGYKKAIIIQSKKLYPFKEMYKLYSRYEGFKKEQYSALKQIASQYCRDGVVYFLYNPKLDAFSEDDAQIIRALEARGLSSHFSPFSPGFFWHPDMQYIFRKYFRIDRSPFVTAGGVALDAKSPEEILGQRKKIIELRPGIRVLGLPDMSYLVEEDESVRSSFHLEECYQYALSDRWWGSRYTVPFMPFSSFIVDMFMSCSYGCDDENLIRIAEGLPPDSNENEKEQPGISARHTLKIIIKNTLPEKDMKFHEKW
jgi:hypothetical protein